MVEKFLLLSSFNLIRWFDLHHPQVSSSVQIERSVELVYELETYGKAGVYKVHILQELSHWMENTFMLMLCG